MRSNKQLLASRRQVSLWKSWLRSYRSQGIDQACYELAEGCTSIYGFEYKPGFDNAVSKVLQRWPRCINGANESLQYITWISDGNIAWTMRSTGMGADPRVEISARPVPQEPMVYLKYPCLKSHEVDSFISSIFSSTLGCRRTSGQLTLSI